MRIHTPKLKAPNPLTVLAICLLWPAAATVGALTSNANANQVESAQAIESAQPTAAQPLHPAPEDRHTPATNNADANKAVAARR